MRKRSVVPSYNSFTCGKGKIAGVPSAQSLRAEDTVPNKLKPMALEPTCPCGVSSSVVGVFWLIIPGSQPSHLPIMWMLALPRCVVGDDDDDDDVVVSCVKLNA